MFSLLGKLIAPGLAFAVFASVAFADDAVGDWQRVIALDSGPASRPKSTAEAKAIALSHLDKQEKVLRGFIAAHPADDHIFEAKIRLARLLRIRGDFENSEKARAEGRELLDALGKTATAGQRVEVDFAKITTLMQSLRSPGAEQRDRLLAAVRRFQTDHPEDVRIPALLAEVATLFDANPKTKENLLVDALRLATDEELKSRVTDDLKRLDLLGKEVPLQFTTTSDKAVDIAAYRGRVVFVVFFATWSPPSLEALATIQKALAQLPPNQVQVLGFSLDSKAETAAAVARQYQFPWLVGFDGKGWESPLLRSLGINTLPTVWLVDAKGRLRSLDALEGTLNLARQLMDER